MEQLGEDSEALNRYLSSFSCDQDADIESFLRLRAAAFEKLSKSRTYLLLDEDKLAEGEFVILGYFALALKVLIIPVDKSIRSRQELDGFSGKIHGEPIREIPCYLIGQIARNSAVEKFAVSGSELMDYALSVIQTSADAVGGRYVLIECHDDAKLLRFYEKNDFHEFARLPMGETPMVQMIRKIY